MLDNTTGSYLSWPCGVAENPTRICSPCLQLLLGLTMLVYPKTLAYKSPRLQILLSPVHRSEPSVEPPAL
jgi:hypothetical protein